MQIFVVLFLVWQRVVKISMTDFEDRNKRFSSGYSCVSALIVPNAFEGPSGKHGA